MTVMRRFQLLWIGLIPILLTAAAVMALSAAEPFARATATPPPTATPVNSNCALDLLKSADPSQLLLGQTSNVTLVVSGTCPAWDLPIDMVIVADQSNSMIRDQGRSGIPTPARPNTPSPGGTRELPPTPGPVPPGSTPGGPGGSVSNDPPFCNPRGNSNMPTALPPTPPPHDTLAPPGTATMRPPPSQPAPGPGLTPPVAFPSQQPTQSIAELEPAGGTDKVREEQSWVRDFLQQTQIQDDLASGRLRIGFVGFNDRARIRQPLTSQASKILGAASRMRGGEITRPDMGLTEAQRQLATDSKVKSDADRTKVILLLSDFQFCQRDVRRTASQRKAIQYVTVGFGVSNYDKRKQYDMTTKREYALDSRDMKKVIDIYSTDLVKGRPVSMAQLTVRDELTDVMQLVPASVKPPTVTITGQLLEWQFAPPPALPITLSYTVQPLQGGLQPISVKAESIWQDSEKLPGTGQFPSVSLDVLVPTETPTNTPTNTPTDTPTNTPTNTSTVTPTPTPKPVPVYLPIVHRDPPEPTPAPTKCVPEAQTIDVALVIDTSTSMSLPTQNGGMPKLQAAIDAAAELVLLLKPADQAAIIGFNSRAYVQSVLTGDKPTLRAALQSLYSTQAVGTHIDAGLQSAYDELMSPRHKSENHRSVVLVTDGKQVGPPGPDAVIAVADQIKAQDILLVTVGLGGDIDEALLKQIATGPEYYFAAPNAEDLLEIYRQIAHIIPCP
jgi:Mg-chelatase subunit ChlD